MGYKGRRTLDRFLLGGAAIVFACAGAIAAAAGDSERITLYWTAAEVTADDAAAVVEVIEYDFGSSQRRGIFRDVPGIADETQIQVDSLTAPDPFIVQPTGGPNGLKRIRIGDPDVEISGRHRYTIEYPLLGIDQGGKRFSWNAVGDNWAVSMDNVEVHIVAPFELSDIQCSAGETGAWDGCDAKQLEPGHLNVVIDELGEFEGVTISATLGAALAAPPTIPSRPNGEAQDPGTGSIPPALITLFVSLAGAALVSIGVRRAGREWVWAGGSADAAYGPGIGQEFPARRVDHADLASLASTEFAPPKNLSAWQGGILHGEKVSRDHQVAWLLERAVTGEIEIEGTDEDLTIKRNQVDSSEHSALDKMFGGRAEIDLGSYDKQFSSGWTGLASDLSDWFGTSEYWDHDGERKRVRGLAFGGVLLIVGLITLIVFSIIANRLGPLWLVGVAVGAGMAGTGYALLQRSWELRIRTPAGSGLWILIESFRRFVHNSDAQHVDAAAKQGLLLDYTTWAVALGEADRWAKAIKEADLDESIAPRAMFYSAMAPSLVSATSSASTAPSSSGGGGGSVGGGGGGGGGGSW